jgi:tetratricopeptide (TPR) repeat protein
MTVRTVSVPSEAGTGPASLRSDAGGEATTVRGELADAMHLQGVQRLTQGDQETAVTLLQCARALVPERSDIVYDHGVALLAAGRLPEAAEAWRRAAGLSPDRVDAWRNLALAVAQTAGSNSALDVYRQALAYHPEDRDLLYNYGNLCFRGGDLDGAAAAQARLLQAHPQFAAGWINAGMTCKAAGRFEQAERCYRQAILLDDQASLALAHFNLANVLLQQGRWVEGFAEYEWRLRLPNALPQPWPAPAWAAEHPAGSRVLVWNDQGIGDAIQYLRLTARLAGRGYRVLVLVQDQLKSLAASAPGVEAAFGPGDPPQPVDAQVPLCSLPHALGVVPDDVWNGPYLRAAKKISLPIAAGGGHRRVGLVWAGNPAHANDANRSMHLADLHALLDLQGITWFSLQLGGGPAELAASPWAGRVHDLSCLLTDFSATAAVILELDLLISVDTAVAHLAGALGRPAWILLPAIGSDWRWGVSGETTAWYPSVRLFRQRQVGAWAPIAAEMTALLTAPRDLPETPRTS